jgi:cell division protein FtsW (lipid II flippase)
MTPRNRELLALVPASLLVAAGFAAIFVSRKELLGGLHGTNQISNVSLTYGGIFLALCVVAHIVIRFLLPNADPYLFPLAALLASFGLVEIYRISDTLARQQAQWFVIGLILFAATIVLLRDYSVLERYRYVVACVGIALLFLPFFFPAVNGAHLSIRLGSLSLQPAEFAKIAIVVFLASYLRDTRQVMVLGSRRFLGLTIPPFKHFGPLLVVWGTAMLVLFMIKDIGSSVMFFGALLAMIYIATGRLSFVIAGLVLFAVGGDLVANHISHIHDRIQAWKNPFDPTPFKAPGGSYQLAQGLFAQADGGILGQGFGGAVLELPRSYCGVGQPACSLLPAPHTDFIYAVIVNELGLVGAGGLIIVYLLVVQRGMKIATLARDSFSKLLAAGLTCVFALQVFVIVGGVTKLIPLTGVTLPFISYGGSSILANFVLLALLLVISEKARREA